ncbi:MAG TPA: hypothetical protein VGL53_28840 [Bryobacteraceae bacterium]
MTTVRSKLMLILATATLFVFAGSRREVSMTADVPATAAATTASVSPDGPFPPPVCPPICPPRVGVR